MGRDHHSHWAAFVAATADFAVVFFRHGGDHDTFLHLDLAVVDDDVVPGEDRFSTEAALDDLGLEVVQPALTTDLGLESPLVLEVVPDGLAEGQELEVSVATVATLVLDLLATLAGDDEVAGVGVGVG